MIEEMRGQKKERREREREIDESLTEMWREKCAGDLLHLNSLT